MKVLILIFTLLITNLSFAVPPVGIGGQNQSLNYINNTIVPYNQATKVGGINTLIETDNENMLINPNFEHSTITTGWTLGTSNTLTATSTSANIFSGKQAGLLTTSATVAFDLHQDITPPSGLAGTQGELTWALAVPAGITDGQICPRVNGAYLTNYCVSAINNGIYFPYKVPFVFGTAGQTAGLGFITTATYASGTQTVLVDKASLKAGLSGVSNLQLDNVYSAQVSATGVISNLNKSGWLSGNCSVTGTSNFDCPVQSGLVNNKLNCNLTVNATTPSGTNSTGYYDLATSTTSNLRLITFNTTNGAFLAEAFTLTCQKQGNDYLSSSSAVYSQQNTGAIIFNGYVATNQALTANVTNLPLTARKDSNSAWNGSLFTVPSGGQGDYLVQTSLYGNAGSNLVVYKNGSALSNIQPIANGLWNSGTTVLPNLIAGDTISLRSDGTNTITGTTLSSVTIQRTTGTSPITGGFAGYTNVPGYQGGVDTFAFSYYGANNTTVCSSNPCTIDQVGSSNAVSSVGWATLGIYTVNFTKTYKTVKCSGTFSNFANGGTTNYNTILTATNSASLPAFTTAYNAGVQNSAGTLFCIGTY